mgnify:CR=1 FL=1
MAMDVAILKDKEFALFQKMIYEIAGIHLAGHKKHLVSGRLGKRLKHFGLDSYSDYYDLIGNNTDNERQVAVDLLTTNETYFFREEKHFEFLKETLLPEWRRGPRRIWSAASSSGEEAFTLAMTLAESSPTQDWEIIGTDLSSRMVEKANKGQYPMERAENIPKYFLNKYCLKGVGAQEGTFLLNKDLRKRTRFFHANLKESLSKFGEFDLIFLRNVLIYFDQETKQYVVNNLVRQLKPGGCFIVGRSESLNGVTDRLSVIIPSVYRKVE